MYFQRYFQHAVYKAKEIVPGKEVRKVIQSVASKNKILLLIILITGFVQSLMDAITLGFVYLAIQLLSQFNGYAITLPLPSFLSHHVNTFSSDWRYFALSIVLFCILVAQASAAISRYYNVLCSEIFAARSKTEVIRRIHRHYFSIEFINSSKVKIGDFYQLTSDSADSIRQEVMDVSVLIENSFSAIAYILVLVAISPVLILVICFALAVIAFLQLKPTSSIKKAFRETIDVNSSINQALSDDYRSLKLIKSMNLEIVANSILTKNLEQLIKKIKKQAILAQRTEALNKLFSIFLVCLMLMISSFVISSSLNIVPALTSFILALQKLNSSTLNISRAFTSLNASVGKLELLEEFLSHSSIQNILNPMRPDLVDVKALEQFPNSHLHSIDFHDVSFRYPDARDHSLENITLSINPGEIIAIVGESGSGKTTLVNILLSLLNPSSGELRVDSVRVDQSNAYFWRNNIAVVNQDTFIKSASIAENISFYSSFLDRDLVYEVLSIVNLIGVVEALPDGIDTIIGDGGMDLSGGQKQRLSLARALYRKPTLLILDEITSSQDAHNEEAINKFITTLRGVCTVLVVSHRLKICTICDKVILLGKGNLLAEGSHSYLMQSSCDYNKLWQAYK